MTSCIGIAVEATVEDIPEDSTILSTDVPDFGHFLSGEVLLVSPPAAALMMSFLSPSIKPYTLMSVISFWAGLST